MCVPRAAEWRRSNCPRASTHGKRSAGKRARDDKTGVAHYMYDVRCVCCAGEPSMASSSGKAGNAVQSCESVPRETAHDLRAVVRTRCMQGAIFTVPLVHVSEHPGLCTLLPTFRALRSLLATLPGHHLRRTAAHTSYRVLAGAAFLTTATARAKRQIRSWHFRGGYRCHKSGMFSLPASAPSGAPAASLPYTLAVDRR